MFNVYCLFYSIGSNVARRSFILIAPLCLHTTSPFLKSIKVGTDWMRYCCERASFLSTSSFRILILSPSSSFSCSNTGCIILHGPHHVAKKSTNVGCSLFIISVNLSILLFLSLFSSAKIVSNMQSDKLFFLSEYRHYLLWLKNIFQKMMSYLFIR